jgi:hypothetical protein
LGLGKLIHLGKLIKSAKTFKGNVKFKQLRNQKSQGNWVRANIIKKNLGTLQEKSTSEL